MKKFVSVPAARRRALGVLLALTLAPEAAAAAELPVIKSGPDNPVAACATPGRLIAFTKARNEKLDPKFESIATYYMRHGEALGIRWDIAFFQMLIETGNLKFGGDVRPSQNNFAGLGATGGGEHGESFKDVSTGVRAHLEHLLMYTGEKVENPVAERTRKVQEWGVLTDWQKTIRGPMTFTQLARKWAPPARKYAAEIASVADSFMEGPCKAADPHPEMVAEARAGTAGAPGSDQGALKAAEAAPKPEKPAAEPARLAVAAEASPADEKVSGKELLRRQVEEARTEGTAQRSALGAGSVAKAAAKAEAAKPEAAKTDAQKPEVSKPVAAALLNPPKPDAEAPAGADAGLVTKTSAGSAAKSAKSGAAGIKAGACKVFTASYGGGKAVIIKAVVDGSTNYTVLDVNEGEEQREAEAYIAAYAPGGKQVGEFPNEAKAMDKAFDLCPEG